MAANPVITWTDTVTGLHLLHDKTRDDLAQLRVLINAAQAAHQPITLAGPLLQRLVGHVEGYVDLLEVTAHQVQRQGPRMFREEV